MSLFGGIWKYLALGGAAAAAVLVFLLKLAHAQAAAEKADKLRYKAKAAGEKAARKHVTETVEDIRDVEDDIRRSDSDRVSDELHDYARGVRSDDPD